MIDDDDGDKVMMMMIDDDDWLLMMMMMVMVMMMTYSELTNFHFVFLSESEPESVEAPWVQSTSSSQALPKVHVRDTVWWELLRWRLDARA